MVSAGSRDNGRLGAKPAALCRNERALGHVFRNDLNAAVLPAPQQFASTVRAWPIVQRGAKLGVVGAAHLIDRQMEGVIVRAFDLLAFTRRESFSAIALVRDPLQET